MKGFFIIIIFNTPFDILLMTALAWQLFGQHWEIGGLKGN